MSRLYTELACHQQFSEENLDILRANPENIFSRIITGDETWVHHHDQRPNKSPCNGNTRGPLLPRNVVCKISWKDHGNSFLGLRRCSAFGIHDTQDSHHWRHLCFHNGGWLYARISNRNAVESCRLVSCCFMSMHLLISLAHLGLLYGNVAS